MAIQNLAWGLASPSSARSPTVSVPGGCWPVRACVYAAGLYLMSTAETAGLLLSVGGVLVGLGVASGSFAIVMAAFARNVPAEQRTFVFGIGTAAGSAGMFVFAPISGR